MTEPRPLCETCGGLGYLPDPHNPGWADPCPECCPDGVREYLLELADIPY